MCRDTFRVLFVSFISLSGLNPFSHIQSLRASIEFATTAEPMFPILLRIVEYFAIFSDDSPLDYIELLACIVYRNHFRYFDHSLHPAFHRILQSLDSVSARLINTKNIIISTRY